MEYPFDCARNFIIESHASGASLWKSAEKNIEFVLTHPNGWEGSQQEQIRRAAKIAGLVPGENKNTSRIHLLTEGEASLHFCANDLASDSLSNLPIVNTEDFEEEADDGLEQRGIIVIDAGGGTIDLSAYSVKLSPPMEFKEIAPAECKNSLLGGLVSCSCSIVVPTGRLQGSVFVTQRAHAFLKGMYTLLCYTHTLASSHYITAKLATSRYGSPDMVQQMKEIFDKTTKLRFRDADDPQYIKFGTVRDRDPAYDIRSGQMKLAG